MKLYYTITVNFRDSLVVPTWLL